MYFIQSKYFNGICTQYFMILLSVIVLWGKEKYNKVFVFQGVI